VNGATTTASGAITAASGATTTASGAITAASAAILPRLAAMSRGKLGTRMARLEPMTPRWLVWTSVAALTCVLVGSYWDISWHMTIGRDSFWTPAHLLIQAGGIIGGAGGAALIFATTFRRDAPLRDASIRVLGFRGPLGAFLSTWGAATMMVSAPFDNWWHSAYGLDVKILSPPHVVLSLGILGVAVGGMVIVLAAMNRAEGVERERLRWVLLVLGGEVLVMLMTSIFEHTFRSNLHTADAYQFIAVIAPLVIVAAAQVADYRWAATLVTGVYTTILLAGLWILPRFPAEPKLGPVYQPITHYVPLHFPMLLVVPALAIDVIRAHMRGPRWRQAIVVGIVFVALIAAVEWPFASFLESSGGRNWVFGSDYLPYFIRPEWIAARHEFFPADHLVRGFAIAAVLAVASTWLGLVIGDAMRRVRR
jgi:hypothetical protein